MKGFPDLRPAKLSGPGYICTASFSPVPMAEHAGTDGVLTFLSIDELST